MELNEKTIYDLLEELRNKVYKAYLNNKIKYHTYDIYNQMVNLIILEIKDIEKTIN